ncbi:SCO7613 C-terminal domain-containing membrane protein [Actinomadura macrotermitis]|uniref:Uncharacterized protein n=1 Tax=Actinomadura macrotermitis TaxID=2585200 RepID=A0A7K0BY68_9ACTN|nr:hypothetical protein [Actinomadura macrotermitis]MQY05802.1 hypothetical protein [Actinomadura macrotermitis]
MLTPCPGCRTPLPALARPSCPLCGLAVDGPAAYELWTVDQQLDRLARRRRDLLAYLYGARENTGQAAAAPVWSVPELTWFGVRNVLLGVGASLLGIAAIVFTLLSWGSLGLLGRALVLLACTAVALGAAWPLVRRGLSATAEAVALVGLLLIILQCVAVRTLLEVDGAWFATGASLLVTALWAGYGRVAPLRLPAPVTLLLAQTPPLFAMIALDVPPAGTALTLVAMSLANLLVRRASTGAVRGLATAAGLLAGLVGTGGALGMAYLASPFAPRFAGVLLAAAAVALAWAYLLDRATAVLAGFALTAALAELLPLPNSWLVAGFAGSALVTAAAARLLPGRPRTTATIGAGLALALAVLWVVPDVLRVVFQAALIAVSPWTGSAVSHTPVIVFAVLAIASAPLLAARPGATAPPIALLLAVHAPGLPYAVRLGLVLTVAGVLAAFAGKHRAAAVGAVVAGAWAAAYALATEPATLAALGALTLIAAACAVRTPALRDAATAFAVLAFAGFVTACGYATGLPRHWSAFGVLAAAALAAALSRRTRRWTEAAALLLMAGGIAMTLGHPAYLSTAFAAAGVIAFGVALRPGHREAGRLGSLLLAAAWWTRLAATGITDPEAYTAPITAALLVIGAVRRRRDPRVSSWKAHGPGLTATLVPSLIAAWAAPDGDRPLLLAAAAFALTLLGGRTRLQAPLLIGAAVLVLDAARQLAPLVADVVRELPGWFPFAVIGLLALAAGATYEQRLRDLRRLRTAVTRMG